MLVQMRQTILENVQLAAYVKYQQTQKIVDPGVGHDGEDDVDDLANKCQLIIRPPRDVVDVMGLQRHRSARVGDVRCQPHRHAETRQNDDEEACDSHQAISARDNYARGLRSSDHDFSFMRILVCFYPILNDHTHDWYDSFKSVNNKLSDLIARLRVSLNWQTGYVKNN